MFSWGSGVDHLILEAVIQLLDLRCRAIHGAVAKERRPIPTMYICLLLMQVYRNRNPNVPMV